MKLSQYPVPSSYRQSDICCVSVYCLTRHIQISERYLIPHITRKIIIRFDHFVDFIVGCAPNRLRADDPNFTIDTLNLLQVTRNASTKLVM